MVLMSENQGGDVSDELRRLDENVTGLYEGKVPSIEQRLADLESRVEALEQSAATPDSSDQTEGTE